MTVEEVLDERLERKGSLRRSGSLEAEKALWGRWVAWGWAGKGDGLGMVRYKLLRDEELPM